MSNAPTKRSEPSYRALRQKQIEMLNQESQRFLAIDAEKSLLLATDALNHSLALQDAQAEAKSRLNIAYACFRLCKYEEALSHVKQAHEIWSQLGDSEKERETLHCLGNIYTMMSNYALAKEYYRQALALAKKVQDKRAEARALTNLGSLSEKEGNFIDALHFSKESLRLLRDIGDKNAEAATLRNIGVMYEKLSDYSTALSYYRQSLALREEIGDERGIARCLNSIGVVYYRQINRAAAIEAFEKCLAIFRHIGDRHNETATLSYSTQASHSAEKSKTDAAKPLHSPKSASCI
jgi:tetratricopeptide (TPR) repeat protein